MYLLTKDKSQALNLAKQFYPCETKFFLEVYKGATSIPHGSLVIDCDPKSPRDLKLRTNIFPDEEHIFLS